MWRQAVLSVSLPLVLITFAAGLTTLAWSRVAYPGEYADPFAPYEVMMPGQGGTSSEFLCDFYITYRFGEAYDCEIRPVNGFFVSVTSSVYNDTIVQTSFSAHDLYVGDIVRHWGQPDVVVKFNHRSFYVLWGEQRLIGIINPIGPIGRFNYLLPVERFTIGLQPHNHP